MNEELKNQLELMNRNLNAMITNQAMIYCKLQEIQEVMEKQQSPDCT